MTLTRHEAVLTIRRHGWEPNDCTWSHTSRESPDGDECKHEDGSFNQDLGIQSAYSTHEVKSWLGY